MKAQQLKSVIQLDSDGRLKISDEFAVIFTQECQRPISNGIQLFEAFWRDVFIVIRDAAEQPRVCISHHNRAIEPAQVLNHGPGLESALDSIAEANDLI